MKVIKRDGREVDFDISKIVKAISKANNDSGVSLSEKLIDEEIQAIAKLVEKELNGLSSYANIEQIQDLVIRHIHQMGHHQVGALYTQYRYKRAEARRSNTTDDTILSLVEYENELVKQENANKNPMLASTQRDYIAGEVSRDLTMRRLLPSDVVDAHKKGIIHFHDADYFVQHIHNCCLVNLEDMLQNGTVITGTQITRPHSIQTAANVATQIIAQVASSQYGGQTISLAHLAPFVDETRQRLYKDVLEETSFLQEPLLASELKRIVDCRLKKAIESAVQTIQYQIMTLMTTNGQTPFVSIYMDINEVPEGQIREDLALLIEEVLVQRTKGLPNDKGVYVTAAFPKLLYVLDENNINEDGKYYYLTELAAKCSAKRMVPDYISAKIMREYKDGNVYPCMGCRSFLTVYGPDRQKANGGNVSNAKNYDGARNKAYGRFNQGVVTVNLPYLALKAIEICSVTREDVVEKYFELMNNLLDNEVHKALRCRHERLKGTLSDISPIHWQYGALARLKPGEPIDKLLYGGYSTLSLGYAGLYETCVALTGKSHTNDEAKPIAIRIMQLLNDKCAKWREEENIDYSVYGTPIETTTGKCAKALKAFPIIKDVNDHEYVTNSYHVCVREKIDAFTKLTFESEFQRLSPGGAISYVELPDLTENIPAVMALIKHIYNTIMYAELNIKSDYCGACGFEGKVDYVDVDGKIEFKCPICGCMDLDKLYIARRVCGYIGLAKANYSQARLSEIAQRVEHVD